jgi:hypothetical protein
MESNDPVELKIALLQEILSITQKMQECSQGGISDEVLSLLEKRGQLIQEIESFDREIDVAKLPEETRAEMLSLLRQIALLNEEVSVRLFAVIAEDQEKLSRMRESQSFLQSVRKNLPISPEGLDIQG